MSCFGIQDTSAQNAHSKGVKHAGILCTSAAANHKHQTYIFIRVIRANTDKTTLMERGGVEWQCTEVSRGSYQPMDNKDFPLVEEYRIPSYVLVSVRIKQIITYT